MLTCPACSLESRRLVIPDNGKLGCDQCVTRKKISNTNLGQTWASDGKTRLTHGKAWEINQRIVSPDDGKTIINRATGKETQY